MKIPNSIKALKFFYEYLGPVFLVCCVLSTGCTKNGKPEQADSSDTKSAVVGFIRLQPKGPFFRAHQTEARVRFFDVANAQTDERTRVTVQANGERFVTRLEPGTYELFRIQIGEGPFRSESHLEMTFEVHANKVTFLGIWQMELDPPKTVRMIKIDVMPEVPEWDAMLGAHPDLGKEPLVISLLQPITNQARLFSVAPIQPRSKYFRRR